MTFDDIQNEIDAGIEDIGFPTEGYHHIMKASEMIDELQERYAPTVEMTKKQYTTFKWHKDNLDFSACLATFQNYNGETRMGHKFDDVKGDLSDEYIMQAWLHPETIKIVDD